MDTTLSTTAGEQGGGTYSTNKPSPAVAVVDAPAAEQMRPAPLTTTAGALQFVVPFKLLPSRMGVSRTRLTALRDKKLLRGTDWDLVNGVCLLTPAAALTLAAAAGALHSSEPSPSPSPEENPAEGASGCAVGALPAVEGCAPEGCVGAELTAPEAKTAPVELTVTRLTLNGRILLATDGRGGTYRVRVKDASKFVPRMVIPCRHVEADVYELAVRMPRQKGKW